MSNFKTVNALPMRTLILNHLLEGNSISNVEAQALWRCRALPKRINEIKAEGYPILRERRADSTGQNYVRYSIDLKAMEARA
ncbi:DNA binding protein [Rhizobium phage Pasto]|uniref:DNA binding protein n=1 Tax=Rhizobium phage Pasto TaxID=2767575 RepID=A0A7S6R811_9CAUD|nr:DNA binding protein [Rhizobium phage Pasto]